MAKTQQAKPELILKRVLSSTLKQSSPVHQLTLSEERLGWEGRHLGGTSPANHNVRVQSRRFQKIRRDSPAYSLFKTPATVECSI